MSSVIRKCITFLCASKLSGKGLSGSEDPQLTKVQAEMFLQGLAVIVTRGVVDLPTLLTQRSVCNLVTSLLLTHRS